MATDLNSKHNLYFLIFTISASKDSLDNRWMTQIYTFPSLHKSAVNPAYQQET